MLKRMEANKNKDPRVAIEPDSLLVGVASEIYEKDEHVLTDSAK